MVPIQQDKRALGGVEKSGGSKQPVDRTSHVIKEPTRNRLCDGDIKCPNWKLYCKLVTKI